MRHKNKFTALSLALLLISMISSRSSLAVDPILVPLPVLNVYNEGSYFQLMVSSADAEGIQATLAIGEQNLAESLSADSSLTMEHMINGKLQSPQINAYPEDGGFVIELTNISEGTATLAIEGGNELSGDLNKDTLAKITLKTSENSKLQMIHTDNSVVEVDGYKHFFSFSNGYAMPIHIVSDGSGDSINTSGVSGSGGTGGEPDKGESGGESFPLDPTAGGCSLQTSSPQNFYLAPFFWLSAIATLTMIALRRHTHVKKH